MEPKAFEIYRHFKGKLYQVITLAEEEATGNMLVIYQGLYAPFKVYARPLSDFVGRLDRVKYPDAVQEYRFERVAETEVAAAPSMEKAEESPAKVSFAGRTEESPAKVSFVGRTEESPANASFVGKSENSPAAESSDKKMSEGQETAGGVNPDLLLFLDAREPEEKLDALFRIKSRLTPDMLTVIEMSQGMEPQETWSNEERYKHIKNDIITKQKYEQKRI